MTLVEQFSRLAEYTGQRFGEEKRRLIDLVTDRLAEERKRIGDFIDGARAELTALKATVLLDIEKALSQVRERAASVKDGNDGKDGEPGPAGKNGRDGIDGKNGTNGCDGKDGAPGKDGIDGKDGLSIRGEAGESGPAGKDGRDGIDGKDGLPGKDGKDGAPGKTGPAGKDGTNGYDGVSIEFMDLWKSTTVYRRGNLVVKDGSLWIARRDSVDEPPDKMARDDKNRPWALSAQRGARGEAGSNGANGKDGRDGRDGADAPRLIDIRLERHELIAVDDQGTVLRSDVTPLLLAIRDEVLKMLPEN